MATCLSQTGAIFVLLAISKPCIRFRHSLYSFQAISSHLSNGTLGIPSWGQVHSFLVKSCICIAYRIPHIIRCSCVGLFTMLCASFRCCFFGLVLITLRLWGSVRLRPFVFFMDSFFFLAGFQARWPYPQNHFYLCLLVARSFAIPMLHTYHLLIMPPILLNQASNPPYPSKPLFGYVTALLSPSYSVVSCTWRLKFVPCWNMEMLFLVGTCLLVGISQYILFN